MNKINFSALIIAFFLVGKVSSQNIQILHNIESGNNRPVITLGSQAIDTAIFITIAFWGLVPSLLWMIFSQYIVKAIIAVLDTPFFYLLTKNRDE